MLPIWLAAIGQGMAQKEQEADAANKSRQGTATDIQSQFSSSMGMPQYMLQAARAKANEGHSGKGWLDMFDFGSKMMKKK